MEYVRKYNLKDAVIAAGYSDKNASVTGARLLKHPFVRAKIDEHKKAVAERNDLTTDWIVQRYMRIVDADIRRLYHETGEMKLPHEIDDDTAFGIQSLEVESRTARGGGGASPVTVKTAKARRYDALHALDSLAKHLKMFSDGPTEDDKTLTVRVVGGLPDPT